MPLGVLLLFVALAGLGTSGTQILLFGFVANYYRTNVRAAGVAWCAGFGRMGGIGGPLIGGILIGAGLGVTQIFLILAGVAVHRSGVRPFGAAPAPATDCPHG